MKVSRQLAAPLERGGLEQPVLPSSGYRREARAHQQDPPLGPLSCSAGKADCDRNCYQIWQPQIWKQHLSLDNMTSAQVKSHNCLQARMRALNLRFTPSLHIASFIWNLKLSSEGLEKKHYGGPEMHQNREVIQSHCMFNSNINPLLFNNEVMA